jgi:hypothetical protein
MTKNRFKDFGKGKDSEGMESIFFNLHGQEFEAIPQIQGSVMLNLVAENASEDSGATARVISSFFSKVLTDESYIRFDTLINSKTEIVTVETLSDIVAWLIEEYTSRPEAQPEV